MNGWGIFVDVVVLGASLVAILDYFGIRPKQHSDGVKMSLSRKWKLAIMLTLVAASTGLSGYATYRSLRPRIVEKTVDRPVDRIVEKLVPQECPKCQTHFVSTPKAKQGSVEQLPLLIPSGTTIQATTNAPDSAAVGVNTGTVNVNPPVNPNAWKVTYNCQGDERDQGQSPNAADEMNVNFGKESGALKTMEDLNKSRDFPALLNLCQEKLKSAPEWLTPYLFCSLAFASTGNMDKARAMLAEYDKKTGPAYATDPCKQISDFLHSHL